MWARGKIWILYESIKVFRLDKQLYLFLRRQAFYCNYELIFTMHAFLPFRMRHCLEKSVDTLRNNYFVGLTFHKYLKNINRVQTRQLIKLSKVLSKWWYEAQFSPNSGFFKPGFVLGFLAESAYRRNSRAKLRNSAL